MLQKMDKITSQVPSSFKNENNQDKQVSNNATCSVATLPLFTITSSQRLHYSNSSLRPQQSSCSIAIPRFARTSPSDNCNTAPTNNRIALDSINIDNYFPRSTNSCTATSTSISVNAENLSTITEESLRLQNELSIHNCGSSFISTNNFDLNNSDTSAASLTATMKSTLNLHQFSNQTLNLDINSQQILRAILQQSSSVNNVNLENEANQENYLQLDMSRLSKAELINSTELNLPPLKDKTYASLLEDSNEEEKTQEVDNVGSKLNKQSVGTSYETLQSQQQLTEEVEGNDTGSNECNQERNSLPVAAISVTMINGQPVYTIQLLGHSIPLAAITVPTSEGTLELQSATTTLTPSHMSRPQTLTECSRSTSTSKDVEKTKAKYTCSLCGRSYIRSWSYHNHLQEHEQGLSKEHKCYVCSKSFTTVGSLKSHLSSKHTAFKKYMCTICNCSFSDTNLLKEHQLTTHAKEAKKCICNAVGCGKVFGNATSLKVHQRVHQDEKPFSCTHQGCDKAFKTSSELSRHEFRHTGEKPYKCDQCGKAFIRNDDLRRHYMTHTGQKKFKCDTCDFSCIQSFDLVKHKYIHGGEKPYKCDKCPKQFTRPARLREHQRLHTGERPYVCEECGKSFTQLTSLKSHKLTHSTHKPFQCEHCDHTFASVVDFKAHVQSHNNATPYTCNICQKSFVSVKTLKRHAIVHTGEKPYECQMCRKKFARPSDLKLHVLVHADEKPYKCNLCTKTFTRSNTLKEHLRTHTGDYPFKCHYCEKEFNHRSHLNVHTRTHTGERPHKCEVCGKEFTRKISLRNHLLTHGINTESTDHQHGNQNYADHHLINPQQVGLNSNAQLAPSLRDVMKRKRNHENSDGDHERDLPPKRQTISYTDFSGYLPADEHFQQHDHNINPSELGSSDILTQVPHARLLSHNETTMLAFNISNLQQQNDTTAVQNLVQIHSLDDLQSLPAHSLMHQQRTLHRGLQHQLPDGTLFRHMPTVQTITGMLHPDNERDSTMS